jgi:hypothetical protein
VNIFSKAFCFESIIGTHTHLARLITEDIGVQNLLTELEEKLLQ